PDVLGRSIGSLNCTRPALVVTTTPVIAVTLSPFFRRNTTAESARRSRRTSTAFDAIHSRYTQPSNGQTPASTYGTGGPAALGRCAEAMCRPDVATNPSATTKPAIHLDVIICLPVLRET